VNTPAHKHANQFRSKPVKVISILAQKGGSGKTTLATSLAVAAQTAGKSVAIIDLDPQATACKWGDRRNADPVIISIQPARLSNALATAKDNGADIVIIDTPPRAADAALAAAQAADLILIPCRPTINDLETIPTTKSLIGGAGASAPIAVVLNAVPPQGQQREQAEDAIRSMGVPVYPVALGHRSAFIHSAVLGNAAQEIDPHGKAAQEIEQLYKFTCKLLNSTTSKKENTDGSPETRPAPRAQTA
jgi:chromosome partitioning protein